MNSQLLNKRKKELLDAQELMLNKAQEAKIALTAVEEESFTNSAKEIDSINLNLARMEAINKGRIEVGVPASEVIIPEFSKDKRKFSNCTTEYADSFWNAMKTRSLTFSNAALGEGGTAADGSFLVPSQTDPSIPALAVIEASARKLSRVITTEMDLKIPYQASKTGAVVLVRIEYGSS